MNDKKYTNIGKREPKLDAEAKSRGKAIYPQDIRLPNMLHGKILWSRYPHAKIVSIDSSRALALPGVKAVITALDLPALNCGFKKDNPPLKRDKVRSLRDEVAAVAAIDEDTAEEALDLIDVKYEELPAVFDPGEALKKGAPVIHEYAPDNLVQMKYDYQAGDVEAAKRESAHVVKDRFKLHYVTHTCLGTCCCVADWDTNGNLTMYSPTQVPFLYQKDLADVLGIAGSRIRVIQPVIGGGFGSKLDLYPYEIICAHLARITGQPVKITFTRQEEFFATPCRQPVIVDCETGVDKNGKLVYRDAHVLMDNGAYVSWGATIPYVMMNPFSSLYRVKNVRFKTTIVYTNNMYAGAFRGYGNLQGTFCVESQMDELAEKLGLDPLEFRLLNCNEPGDVTAQGMKVTTCGLRDCLKKATEMIGWKEKKPGPKGDRVKRGVGLASYFHVGGGARVYMSDGCGAIVKLDDFGKVTLITGSTDIGQGSETVLAQIAAEELGVRTEDVTVINTDTSVKPWDVGVHASRTTFIAGNAARMAAAKARTRILESAALMLNAPCDDLDINDRVVYSKSDSTKNVSLVKVLRKLHFKTDGAVIVAEHFYDPPQERQDGNFCGNISVTYSFGTQAVEIEVDTETGKVTVVDFAVANDVGKAINPMLLEGQLEGAAAQGIGYGIYENLQIVKGEVKNPTFLDYKIVTSKDMPPIRTALIETDDPAGPFGAKGIGEAGAIPTAAAIANAFFDATGVRMRDLPLGPETVLRALRESGKAVS
ncbi:MAG: xanthine dehydrogenase family protein molybdopterin-binding subunit [Planctomycetota bacterium]|nr:xanthine dehydrogenase family protein molybdopterin-binding subunit [Planctomycetota bacterium]